MSNDRPTAARVAVFVSALALVIPAALYALIALGLPLVVTILLALLLGAAMYFALRWLPPDVLAAINRKRALLVVWLALALFAAVRLAGVGAFLRDAKYIPYSAYLSPGFYTGHCCLSGYAVAAANAAEGRGIYDKTYKRPFRHTPLNDTIPGPKRLLFIDFYHYPPPFLLLPELLLKITTNFSSLRSLWFLLNVVVFALGLVVVMMWCSAGRQRALLFGIPVLLLIPPTLATLQIGNFQLFALALAMMGMVAFDKNRVVLGGGLLGFAAIAKIFPGLLVLYLLLKRRWRPVIATAIAMAVFAAVALLVFGWKPFDEFLRVHVPKLASGDAFSFLTKAKVTGPVVENTAPFGIPYKLGFWGVLSSDPQPLAIKITWAFTVVLLLAIGVAVFRSRSSGASGGQAATESNAAPQRLQQALIWLAILNLGQMRSPFLPIAYAPVGTAWLIFLLYPLAVGKRWRVALWAVLFAVPAVGQIELFLYKTPPSQFMALSVLSTTVSATMLGVNIWVLTRRPHTSAAPAT